MQQFHRLTGVDKAAAAWARIRVARDELLRQCDWTMLPDSPKVATQLAAWKQYRQTLRDIPQKQTDPFNISWPTPPVN